MEIKMPPLLSAYWDWSESTGEQSYVRIMFGNEEVTSIPAVREVTGYIHDGDAERQEIVEVTVAQWLREKLA